MLSITEHHDSDLSREQIIAVCSLVYGFWPSKDKTVDQVVESFPEADKRHRVSYPQVRRPSLRYLVWDKDKAVAHALTFDVRSLQMLGRFRLWRSLEFVFSRAIKEGDLEPRLFAEGLVGSMWASSLSPSFKPPFPHFTKN